MNKAQVFKVKGMHRDLSMPNASGEFAYEIVNMRVMPAEEGSGFSLTNEIGLVADSDVSISGNALLGQCPTTDSLIVFSKHTESDSDYIEKLYHDGLSWVCDTLYRGKLNFRVNAPIEALFNYETEDIQKVYWIDGINQLRCINIADTTTSYNDSSFDSIKEIESVPSVDLSLSAGGKFTAGVLQYYITYFNKFSSESPILYTSPLLHIAHEGRGGNTNDGINTAYRLKISDLDNSNWEYIRIYATHRTSLEATPEGSIIAEIKIPDNKTIDFTDYGSNRVSIDPNDLHFVGGKHIVAGTMTAKDQVLFLGNLKIDTNKTLDYDAVNSLFADLRANGTIDDFFFTNTTKTKENKLSEYEDKSYYYKSNLNNTEPITHYKYGEKYRFGISLMDKYGNWSNPIWIKDAFITVAPEQIDGNTLALPCPQLKLSEKIPGQDRSLWDVLKDNGAISIKPLVVFPSIDERKVLAQGVVCPTVYNLKDRKENGPYAQASWFMRPNAPIDLWNLDPGTYNTWISENAILVHNSDLIFPDSTEGYHIRSYKSILNPNSNATKWLDTKMSLVYDDLSISRLTEETDSIHYANGYGSRAAIKAGTSVFNEDIIFYPEKYYNSLVDDGEQPYVLATDNFDDIAKDIVSSGSWVEFRHNYALRTKGWTWGPTNDWYNWNAGIDPEEIFDYEWIHDKYPLRHKNYSPATYPFTYLYDSVENKPSTYPKDTNGIVTMGPQDGVNYNHAIYFKFRLGSSRCAELDTSRFGATIPVNRFCGEDLGRNTWRNVPLIKFNTGNSAYYVDSSIVTFHSPEVEAQEDISNITPEGYDFRIIGVVPLTATISDISLEYSGAIYNPSINTEVEFGLKKNLVRNKNIGYHGFKGLVAHSTLFSGHNAPNDIEYNYKDNGNIDGVTSNPLYSDYYAANFPLHPWQSTGNIPGFDPTWEEKGNYTTLKRKILSNLRYSANSCFYNLQENLDISELSDNEALLSTTDNKIMGWKPSKGSNIQWFNSTEQSIVKLNLDGYNSDLVYSANIDSIALATSGENTPIPIYSYFYGRKLAPTDSIETGGYTPYIGGACFDDVYKTGIGSSIKYKSSPHAVIGFNAVPVTIEGTSKWTQEILPSFWGINLASNNYQSIGQIEQLTEAQAGHLYEDDSIISIPHQSILPVGQFINFGLPGYNAINSTDSTPNYGWLWLGELYKPQDPTFGGDTEYALQNNSWETGGTYSIVSSPIIGTVDTIDGEEHELTFTIRNSKELEILFSLYRDSYQIILPELITESVREFVKDETRDLLTYESADLLAIKNNKNFINFAAKIRFIKSGYYIDIIIDPLNSSLEQISKVFIQYMDIAHLIEAPLKWTIGDTYYQRFDTLKTYAYSDKDENSIVDITSFMVETRVNIDGRYDRNRGQDSNLQMSPTNFNLINDAYSQRDNFFTYRILDKDVQSRTEFPNQITWSLSKTAGATVDAWINHTLASVLDLDGTKGNLTALKTFGDQIISFQETGISTILFNSRVQIPTSEYVPIQIANSGKVDGQQYLTTDLGCQDKWNIVTTPSGLYFVDYYNKSIYRFNGKVEDLSTVGGFRGWCNDHLYDDSQVLGYYDKKNKEVLFYGNTFGHINGIKTPWLGFSEITNTFSSFYTFPKAALSNVKDRQIWLVYNGTHNEDEGRYENVYSYYSDVYGKNRAVPESSYPYGLTAIVRQDSNIVKTFNSVEFRADTYRHSNLQNDETFDTIQIEDEYNGKTSDSLEYKKYRPSNLKKFLRTWRAYIPRVDNKTKRYVNQWAKVGLWKTKSTQEKTVLHDMAVWYSE